MTGEITTKRTATQRVRQGPGLRRLGRAAARRDDHRLGQGARTERPEAGGNDPRRQANESLTFWITISAPELANGQYFGRITLDPTDRAATPVTIPVAFFKKQGTVTLTHTCAPTTFPAKTGAAHCIASVANFGSVGGEREPDGRRTSTRASLDFTNIAAPATAIKKDDGVQWSGTLTPAIPPQVTAITDITGNGPAGGYLPLSLFGIAPVAGVGDDTITNFNVPTFFYGGEPYTRIGVVSNGYVVIGGGTAADIVFAPQTSRTRHGRTTWSRRSGRDINPAGGRAIRIGDADRRWRFTWLVVDWAGVKNFSNATTHTLRDLVPARRRARHRARERG